ncbi:hypothetical protein Pelo_4884 [Pelomyxa schiedti]|nr:hypothetical protein Pelo_4884 [Pelomyxa schiedti]
MQNSYCILHWSPTSGTEGRTTDDHLHDRARTGADAATAAPTTTASVSTFPATDHATTTPSSISVARSGPSLACIVCGEEFATLSILHSRVVVTPFKLAARCWKSNSARATLILVITHEKWQEFQILTTISTRQAFNLNYILLKPHISSPVEFCVEPGEVEQIKGVGFEREFAVKSS